MTGLVTGCTSGPTARASDASARPRAELIGAPIRIALDGESDDLLTAGLGTAGLLGPPPSFADPLHPTARELRRRAIYMNYRGLADLSAEPGGGPAIGGTELLVGLRSPVGPSTVMLQIPRGFDVDHPCLVAVASSGSRGIYGALPTAGGWGLRHGCAVIHTDKGTGSGVFDIASARGVRIDGTAAAAGDPLLSFDPEGSAVTRLAAQRPNAVLFRHANSGLNVEAHWGEYLLQAIEVAFDLLNAEFPHREAPIAAGNTRVIAAGISNGGGTVLRAFELDRAGWIDGAVVSEPNVNVPERATAGLVVESGTTRTGDLGTPFYDIVTAQLLMQPCALLAEEDAQAPFRAATVAARPALEQWCRDLAARGELGSGNIDTLARVARERLLGLGLLPETLRLGHVNVHTSLWLAVGVAYAAAYARMAPDELPCGVSFAATDAAGAARPPTGEELARMFADSNGIAPTAGVNLVAAGVDGKLRNIGVGSVDLALCLQGLRARVAAGIAATTADPRPDRRPLVLIHGRGDGLIAVNHSSRPYYYVSAAGDPETGIRYYEIERGQHFDAFLPLPGFAGHYVAMQPFFDAAMDLVEANLSSGQRLPPSQVVRAAILTAPGANAITLGDHVLRVPE